MTIQLDTPQGRLDITSVYLPSGQRAAERADTIDRGLAAARNHTTSSLWIAGDWNFAAEPDGRWCLQAGAPTGAHDGPESRAWDLQAKRHALVELFQTEHTHRTTSVTSRLDRIYTSCHIANKQDREFYAACGAWCTHASAHRPVFGGCRTPLKHDRPLSMRPEVLADPRWSYYTRIAYAAHPAALHASAFAQLEALKQCMWTAHDAVMSDRRQTPHSGHTNKDDDRVAIAMRTLRAREKALAPQVAALYSQWPFLHAVAPWRPDGRLQDAAALQRLRDYVVTETRTRTLAEMRALQAESDEDRRQGLQNSINQKLSRLRPGTSSCLQAMISPQGDVLTSHAEMAALLRDHWARVFTAPTADDAAATRWAQLVSNRTAALGSTRRPAAWEPTRADLSRALRLTNNSAAGPDGIPYLAWRRIPSITLDVLWNVLQALLEGKSEELRHFSPGYNTGTLVCLPKKASAVGPQGQPAYTANQTRPLSLVNTDNRIVANTLRLTWEALLQERISPHQRGFLRGRSLLENVCDVEDRMRHIYISGNRGATLLLDFASAFPSVSRSYLLTTLSATGLPPRALNAVRMLYTDTTAIVSLGGARHGSFPMTAGIRQGCPLSPLLFAACTDELLRQMQEIPSTDAFAFADDTAVTTACWPSHGDAILALLRTYSGCSGMNINWEKTVYIPLHEADPAVVEGDLRRSHPEAPMAVLGSARYLGFYVGPATQQQCWEAPLRKFHERLQHWPWSRMGLQLAVAAYNTYVLPTLLYVAQLRKPPAEVLAEEARALSRVLPGPGGWITQQEAFTLAGARGARQSLHSLEDCTKAAQLRVYHWEARRQGGLRAAQRWHTLREAISGTAFLPQNARTFCWLLHPPSRTLQENVEALGEQGVHLRAITAAAVRGPLTSVASAGKVRKRTQGLATRMLRDLRLREAPRALARRLRRWHLQGSALQRVRRCLSTLQALRRDVAPRVTAAVLSTIHNRWTTARRFQRSGTRHRCVLGCCEAPDSLEHYGRCPVLRSAMQRCTATPSPPDFLPYWLGAERAARAERRHWAWTCYAAYRTHNHLRHHPRRTPECIPRMVQQFWIEAQMGFQRTPPARRRALARANTPPPKRRRQ
jgi:hypothetical protein